MAHIFDVLHEDHERVADMLSRIGSAPAKDPDTVTEILEDVRRDLEVHASFEEAEVYPAIERATGKEEPLEHAVEEHDEAIELLDQIALSVAEGQDGEWKKRVEELKSAIEHHVEEEENKLFPSARNRLSKSEAEELADHYRLFKERIAAE
jgi:hemerythrin-like domain-containing protein